VSTTQLLQQVQLAIFLLAAAAALRLWWRHRTRPSWLLALTFGTLGLVLLVSRLLPEGDGTAVAFGRDLVVAGLAAFPWLLALFAWSFEPRLPRWLLAAGAWVLGLAVWLLVLPPLPQAGEPRSGATTLFLTVFVGVWVGLASAAAVRLWQVGGSQQLVRARMRMMAGGALVLTVALLLLFANATSQVDSPVRIGANLLAILSALLFVAGFAPPRPLRLWWRRRATNQWQQMQLELIAAATPARIAQAVTPNLSELLGVGVAVAAPDGRLLACSRLDDAEEVVRRLSAGEPAGEGVEVHAVDRYLLVIRTTPYTPLFGQDERDLIEGFALQFQLAFERAELFEANLRANEELQRASVDQQAMMTGLAHDLRSPALTISGYTALLRQSDDPDERAQMLDSVESSTTYLNDLVDALVELAKVGSTMEAREPVDLARLVDDVVRRLSASYPGVHVLCPTPLPTIQANPLGMAQVFENLLTNAARHGGRDDLTITVAHRVVPGGARIEVRDNGRGIHPDDRETIFTPFRRGRGAAAGGSGVGLGLVRRIVEAHGGTIALLEGAASAPCGAAFVIELPSEGSAS
jgi:signal transduction histidine kinase